MASAEVTMLPQTWVSLSDEQDIKMMNRFWIFLTRTTFRRAACKSCRASGTGLPEKISARSFVVRGFLFERIF
ncbi:MAG: hypothetical protein HFI63_07425 [Lachnospiraceae bacterium]|nr:hypothetical protein [Lachnospiraceae bacterium]